jgi:hypothetical protein
MAEGAVGQCFDRFVFGDVGDVTDRFDTASIPLAANSATVLSSAPCSISAITIFAPSRPRRSPIARPTPLAPPVMTAILPLKSFILFSFSGCPEQAAH